MINYITINLITLKKVIAFIINKKIIKKTTEIQFFCVSQRDYNKIVFSLYIYFWF